MDFEILINESFANIATDQTLSPISNKSVLSIANDFEDNEWRYENFNDFIWDNIALTALSAQERNNLADRSHSKLRASAKNLRLTDKPKDIGKGSELAEIALYGIMHHHYGALPVVPKIFYKQNVQDNAKGADSVHIVIEENGEFSLWFGEAKFYNSIEDARLASIIESVSNSLSTDKLKKENSIITNTSDIDKLIDDAGLVSKIKSALSYSVSIDTIKPKLHIPILLLHECKITASTSEMTDEYRQEIIDYHQERANAYFTKQIDTLATSIAKYAEIKFHIILFPVPDRSKVINNFTGEVAHYKG